MAEYLIWSFEHNGWWAPGGGGYCNFVDEAGRYTLERASEICTLANIGGVHEAVVPLPEKRVPAQRPLGVAGGLR